MSPHERTARAIDLLPVVVEQLRENHVVHRERIVVFDHGDVAHRQAGAIEQLLDGERGRFGHEARARPRLGLRDEADVDLRPPAQRGRLFFSGDNERRHAVGRVRLAAGCDARVELAHLAERVHRELPDALVLVDAAHRAALHVQQIERHADFVEEARVLRFEVLLVPAERHFVDFTPIELVLPRGRACRGDHGLAGGRIESEVVPDVAEGEGPLVGPPLGKDADGGVAGAVEGQDADDVTAVGVHLSGGGERRLQTRGARLLEVEAGNTAAEDRGEHRRVPEFPVPRDRRAENQIVERLGRHAAKAEDAVHRLGGELSDVHFRERGRLPRGKITAAPASIRDTGLRIQGDLTLHRGSSGERSSQCNTSMDLHGSTW